MDAATIEETNRIRVSLGMKPLPVPGGDGPKQEGTKDDVEAASTIESRQALAMDNLKKLEEADAAKTKREERAAAVRKAREQAQRSAKLEGKGLGEADEGDVDAKAWLMGQKKRQKKIEKARKLEEQLAAAEAEAAAAVQYTSKDLAGIKVAHDMSSFLDGDEQILTLKDSAIDANNEEDDELENLGLRETEKLADRLDLKKKKPGYNPMDDDEDQGGILAQYDEEINGKKTKNFTLDTNGTIAELSDILAQPVEKGEARQNVNIDDIVGESFDRSYATFKLTALHTGDAPISSDYLAASEIKVKKPKKKKNKQTRQKALDEDDIFPLETALADSSAMDIDSNQPTGTKKRKVIDDTFVDDEDLQASLAMQRRNALKKRKKMRPEDIAKELRFQEDDQVERSVPEEQGLVIGEVSEFVSGLSKPDEEEEERKPRRRKSTTKSPQPDEDQPMTNDQDEEALIKKEQSEQDEQKDASVEEEKTVGSGMGAALSLLRERGLVESSNADSVYGNFRSREEFLSRKRLLEEELDDQTRQQRERDRMSGKLDKMSTREREEWARQQNVWRDQQQSKRMAELYSTGYKPNVELRYTDEHGRQLDQKEAFKHLSHKFHGKGSGKGKTEKLLKKIDDEKRREAQSMFDASQNGGMSVATAQQLKKRKEAGVRLG
jgi:U4/U6.U5 tri-snRNP-associated protein 1